MRGAPARHDELVQSAGAESGLVLRGVGRSYPGPRGEAVRAVEDVDLAVPRGRFTTLFGPSGCGKSTLLRLAAGLERPDAGEVRVDGAAPEVAARAKDVAWVPQRPALLPWLTVRANAALPNRVNRSAGRARTGADVDGLLAELGLGGSADARPAQLSGGMRQRVALARGFAQGAGLMLMDEPFSALDEITREAAQLVLARLWERHRAAVLFVTHSAAEAVLLSDRVVVMTPRPGRVQAVVDVDLPRPRDRSVEDSPAFAETVLQVKRALRDGMAAA